MKNLRNFALDLPVDFLGQNGKDLRVVSLPINLKSIYALIAFNFDYLKALFNKKTT
jgi:hypothetical protein